MGVDYSAHLAVGFVVTEKSLFKAFGVQIQPVWHLEDRFDPRTGAKLSPEKVVDQEGGTSLYFNGDEKGNPYELVEAISSHIDCYFWCHGSGMNDDVSFVIGPQFESSDGGLDFGMVKIDGGASFESILALRPELERIGKALTELKVEHQDPVVMVAGYCS